MNQRTQSHHHVQTRLQLTFYLRCCCCHRCCCLPTSRRDVAEDAARFREALASVALVAAGCSVLLQVLQLAAVLSGAAADGVDVRQMLLNQLLT